MKSAPFLETLLTDRDVIRTRLPKWAHNFLFRRIAKRRSVAIRPDYELIGGKSPIFEDTEEIATRLREKLDAPVLTFHRYLPATHQDFLDLVKETDVDEWITFPFFPQFSYATTGSIARFFQKNLPKETVSRMRWIKSYPSHPSFVKCYQDKIRKTLDKEGWKEEETVLLFSPHGLPQSFDDQGDIYQNECQNSYEKIKKAFPKALCKISYQSKFGPGQWIKPYTEDTCKDIDNWSEGRDQVIFVPLSFTSDHIETLFEVETLYLPIVKEKGKKTVRCDALNQDETWVDAILTILKESDQTNTEILIRK